MLINSSEPDLQELKYMKIDFYNKEMNYLLLD